MPFTYKKYKPFKVYKPRAKPAFHSSNDIFNKLKRAQEKAENGDEVVVKTERKELKASQKDMEFRKKKMGYKQRAEVEALEKDLKKEEEKCHLSEKKVVELKKLNILTVEKFECHVEENTEAHHTDLYSCTDDLLGDLVVRRGQEFNLTFTFQRPFSGKEDDIYLLFSLEDIPNPKQGTEIKIKLEEGNNTQYKDGPKKSWGARIVKQDGNDLTVAVYPPPKAIIGQFDWAVITKFEQDGKKKSAKKCCPTDIFLLLNPWCKDDQVYMKDQCLLKEYVLNECGCVFSGSSRNVGCKPWFYGQFQDNILEISLHLVRKAFDWEISDKMGDPLQLSRALSRIINACDDDGVLIGNWSGDYSGGTRPLAWRGSVNILEEYYEKRKGVMFGQCWVFSHVLTTVARAIGLPCRSVTNFASSHDTDSSMTIDKFIDHEGNVHNSGDSIWNFHVWNETWMHRPDLDQLLGAKGKYDGWHAIDATPQEKSDSVFQCGPSPVSAIRYGDVHVGFDTKFIFAEVNAEICHWGFVEGDRVLISKNSYSVGKKISTKQPNGCPMDKSFFAADGDNRLDVTDEYKHPEGSIAEREAVKRALAGTEAGELIFGNPTGIEIEFPEIPEPKVGEDVKAMVVVKNTASEARSCEIKITARPMTYFGEVIGDELIEHKFMAGVNLAPKASKEIEMFIEADKYIKECDEHLAMTVLAMATVTDFEKHVNRVFASDDIKVREGKVEVKGPEEKVPKGEPLQLKVAFKNPTKHTLTNCSFEIEGPIEVLDKGFSKIKKNVYKKMLENMRPGKEVGFAINVKPNLKPKKSLEREVEVGFMCDELPDFDGGFTINLK